MTRLSPAEQLLHELGVSEPREIHLEAIAWHVGVRVKYEPLESCEARILGYGNRAIATIDPHRGNRRRARFSLAHELGHWRYHRGKSFVCRPDDIGNATRSPLDPERVADAYAADLLMPGYLFKPLARKSRTTTFELVENLSKTFETSLTATALRIVDFGPEPAMLICHTSSGRKWFKAGRDIPQWWFPRDELDAESYAFDVLFGHSDRSRRALIDADAWFDRGGADRYQLYEQSVRISDVEILTLLLFKDEGMLAGA